MRDGNFIGARGSPSDSRGFIHKKLFGVAKGAIGGFISGGPLGALGGAARGFVGGGQAVPTPRISRSCPPGFVMGLSGCSPGPLIRPILPPAAVVPGPVGFMPPAVVPGATTPTFQPQQDEFGDAVKGRFGAAIEPAVRDTETRVCPRGAVLAVDGLCYNRRDIRNTDRMWPRGRRPLLTGGQMRAISIASSAAKALQRKQKQLEALGMLKRPARRSAPKALPPAHHHHDH